MEFERALFRVYERSIEGLLVEEDAGRADEPMYKKSCKLFEVIILVMAASFAFVLGYLHTHIVGATGCLPQALTYYNASSGSTQRLAIHADTIIGVDVATSLLHSDDDALQGSDAANRRLRGIWTLLNESSGSQAASGSWNSQYEHDYVITFDRSLTFLSDELKASHGFPEFNVTLPVSQECFGGPLLQHLIPVGGLDTVMLNYAMYSTRSPGYMVNKQGEVYHWRAEDYRPYSQPSEWLRYKLSVLCLSVLAFFCISTTTALLVRTLISSGIVIIFPVIWALQLCGINALNLRIIAISYPWIGLPLQMIRARQQPLEPFIFGHITRAVLYYILYISAQNLFISWFYSFNSVLGEEQLYLYAVMMLWEYYSMIYMRSAASIQVFPRACMALFVLFHIYYYSFPTGFHILALTVMTLSSIVLMVHCVRVYETKAFRLGHLSVDQPRMLFNALPWPMWRADLAPDYTLFMPVTHLSRGIYQNNVPLRPGTEAPADPPAPADGDLEMRNMPAAAAAPAEGGGWPAASPLSIVRSWLTQHNYESIQAADQSTHTHPAVSGSGSESDSSSNSNSSGGATRSALHEHRDRDRDRFYQPGEEAGHNS